MKLVKIGTTVLIVIVAGMALTLFLLSAVLKSDDEDRQVTDVSTSVNTEISVNGKVSLESIEAPLFGDVIAHLGIEQFKTEVQWGVGDDYVMWYVSGYPGFGYNIVIEAESIPIGENVTLRTTYGVYRYKKIEEYQAFSQDNNLVDVQSQRILTNFGVVKEILFLYSSEQYITQKYQLVEQTEIVL